MIQAALSYQFLLNQDESGDINPEFRPIKLIFNNNKFSVADYSKLINELDIFGIFYSHVTARFKKKETFGNFFMGRLRLTPYQVISYFHQEPDKSQFLTIIVFELDDEIEIYENIIKKMSKKLEKLYSKLRQFRTSKKPELIEEIVDKIEKELKFVIFQVDRLSQLEKVQKAALIFNNEERLKILEILRERPISKKELKDILENIKPNPNIDILIQPFLELRLIRRDWIKGERDRKSGEIKNKGEFLFLTKDISILRLPSKKILNQLKDENEDLYETYKRKVDDYFKSYNPNEQSVEDLKTLSNALLNPDVFDFYRLMQSNFYPLKKIPKILSEFVDFQFVIDTLEYLNIITKLKDKEGEEWVILLTEIVPLIFFPEYLLEKVKESYKKEKGGKLSFEIVEKAFELLEVAYPEKVEF
jgi:hypothetical protein